MLKGNIHSPVFTEYCFVLVSIKVVSYRNCLFSRKAGFPRPYRCRHFVQHFSPKINLLKGNIHSPVFTEYCFILVSIIIICYRNCLFQYEVLHIKYIIMSSAGRLYADIAIFFINIQLSTDIKSRWKSIFFLNTQVSAFYYLYCIIINSMNIYQVFRIFEEEGLSRNISKKN